MTVGILEISTKNHYVLVNGWTKVLSILGHEIIIYTTQEISELIEIPIGKIEIKICNTAVKYFLNNISSDSLDLMIITSLQKYLPEFNNFKPKYKLVLTVHNANTWFLKNNTYKPKDFIKRFIRNSIRKRISAFFVCSYNIKKYVESQIINEVPKMGVMPFSLYLNDKNEMERNNMRKTFRKISFPGIISGTRKDYDVFFELAKRFPNIEFLLLGAPSKNPSEKAESVIIKLENMKLKNVRYFKDFLSPSEFSKELRDTNMIFGNVKTQFVYGDVKETYGVTKDSGITYLMIDHNLPGLLNSDFQNLPELESSTFYYNSVDSATEIINKIINDTTYWGIKRREALESSNIFSPHKIAPQIKEFLQNI